MSHPGCGAPWACCCCWDEGVSVCGIHQLSERCGHGLQKHQSVHPVWPQKDCHGGHRGKATLRRLSPSGLQNMHNTVVCYIVFICIYFLHWICGELHYFCCVICIAFGVMFFIFLVNKPFYSQLPISSIFIYSDISDL